jgi:hypothetical protein
MWLANPAFWAGAVFFVIGRRNSALVASGGALFLGCWHVFAPLIFVGYYVWLGSSALLALACALGLLSSDKPSGPNTFHGLHVNRAHREI